MGGKNNAKPAKKTSQTNDAAMVETADDAVEQPVTAPAQVDAPDMAPAESQKIGQGGEGLKDTEAPSLTPAFGVDLETFTPEQFALMCRVASFHMDGLYDLIYCALSAALIRRGDHVEPLDIFAVSIKGGAAVVVTKSGQKYTLKELVTNEA